MATDMTTLLAGGGGALAALAGGALSPFLTRRHEHRQWRRDKLAGYCEDLRAVLLGIEVKIRDMPSHLPQQEGPDSDFRRLVNAVAGVSAYGTQKLGVAAYDLVDKYQAIMKSADEPESPAPLYREFQDRAGETLKMMRRELRL